MKSILNPEFRYVPSTSTDIRKTFARVRRDMAVQAERDKQEAEAKVAPIRKVKP